MGGVTSNPLGRKTPGLAEPQVVCAPSEMTIGGDRGGHARAPPRGARDENVSPAPTALDFKFRIRVDAGILGKATYTLHGRRNQGLRELPAAPGPPSIALGGIKSQITRGAALRSQRRKCKARALDPRH